MLSILDEEDFTCPECRAAWNLKVRVEVDRRVWRTCLSCGFEWKGGTVVPDEVFNYAAENWDTLGYTPIITFRLLERGWSNEDLNRALTCLIGADWMNIDCSKWQERMTQCHDMGGLFESPEWIIYHDGEGNIDVVKQFPIPFVEIMDRLVFYVINQGGLVAIC
jgi:hypothetical protein